jgi:hypothetical protein
MNKADLLRITELEKQVDALDRALSLLLEAIERLDARVGEWDRK